MAPIQLVLFDLDDTLVHFDARSGDLYAGIVGIANGCSTCFVCGRMM